MHNYVVQNWDFHNPSSTQSIKSVHCSQDYIEVVLIIDPDNLCPLKNRKPTHNIKNQSSSYNAMAQFWFRCLLLLAFSYVVIRVSALGIHFLYFDLQKEKELQKLTQEEINFKSLVRDLFQKVEEAKSSLAMNRSRGKVLDAIIQEKKSGRIPGIYGRLVNLFINNYTFFSDIVIFLTLK